MLNPGQWNWSNFAGFFWASITISPELFHSNSNHFAGRDLFPLHYLHLLSCARASGAVVRRAGSTFRERRECQEICFDGGRCLWRECRWEGFERLPEASGRGTRREKRLAMTDTAKPASPFIIVPVRRLNLINGTGPEALLFWYIVRSAEPRHVKETPRNPRQLRSCYPRRSHRPQRTSLLLMMPPRRPIRPHIRALVRQSRVPTRGQPLASGSTCNIGQIRCILCTSI